MSNLDFLNDRGQRILWGSQYALLLEKPLFPSIFFKFLDDYDLRSVIMTRNPILRFINKFKKEWHEQLEKETSNNYSLDEFTGLICWCIYFNEEHHLKYVPLFGYHSMRPDVFLFILMAKYKWLRPFLMWVQVIAILLSCHKVIDKRPHGTFIATSGKLLAWCKIKAFKMHKTNKIALWLIKRGGHFNNWAETFDYYHKERFKDIPKVNYEVI